MTSAEEQLTQFIFSSKKSIFCLIGFHILIILYFSRGLTRRSTSANNRQDIVL
jgi:hypothetical protein